MPMTGTSLAAVHESVVGTIRPLPRLEIRSADWVIPDAIGIGS
jgi:hypothetical protein